MIKNDIAAGEGVNVSFFTQGCPFKCKGCHNPQAWDFSGGKEFSPAVLDELLEALSANGVKRNLSIMGGEPLCEENIFLVSLIILSVKEQFPDIKIYVWTGYTYEELEARSQLEPKIKTILDNIDYLIDGRFELDKRDITLAMRGSSNQRILDMRELRNNEH